MRRIRQNEQFRRAFFGVLLATLGGVGAWYFYQQNQLNHKQAVNDEITSRINALNADIEQIYHLENEQKALLDKANLIRDLNQNRVSFVRIFEYLASAGRGLVYFEHINLAGDLLTLSGVSKSAANVSQFAQSISANEHSMMTDAMVTSLQEMPNGAVSFIISVKLTINTHEAADDLADEGKTHLADHTSTKTIYVDKQVRHE